MAIPTGSDQKTLNDVASQASGLHDWIVAATDPEILKGLLSALHSLAAIPNLPATIAAIINNVLLPQPLGPTCDMNSPRACVNETLLSARTSPSRVA